MKRQLYCAQHDMNPTATEKFPSGFTSGDTLPEPDWDTPLEGRRMGSVQEGVSMTEPLNRNQPKVNRSKRR